MLFAYSIFFLSIFNSIISFVVGFLLSSVLSQLILNCIPKEPSEHLRLNAIVCSITFL